MKVYFFISPTDTPRSGTGRLYGKCMLTATLFSQVAMPFYSPASSIGEFQLLIP